MDQLDQRLLELLRQNSRTSNTQIARKLGITEGAVRNRIKKLVQTGVIKRFTVELAQEANIEAIVLIRTQANQTKQVALQAKKISQNVFETSGEYDVAVHIYAKNVDELNQLVDKIRALEGVTNTTTLIKLVSDP
ncbi:MAG: Lrp/AsnC family transcriptional regulator [Thermoprotei archaeon]